MIKQGYYLQIRGSHRGDRGLVNEDFRSGNLYTVALTVNNPLHMYVQGWLCRVLLIFSFKSNLIETAIQISELWDLLQVVEKVYLENQENIHGLLTTPTDTQSVASMPFISTICLHCFPRQ